MAKINKKFYHPLNFFFSIVFVLSAMSPQTAFATIFQPGETLEPDCAPGSPNCGVAVFSLNGQTNTTQTLVTGSAGTDFSISSLLNIHTFNLPSASALNRGLLIASDWSLFNAKQNSLGFVPLDPANNLSDVADTNVALNNLLPSQAGNAGKVLQTDGSNTSWVSVTGTGTVTDFVFTNANGIIGSVSTSTTVPTLSLSLGAITPTSVAASGTVTGSNLSGINTGDQTSVTGNAGTATALQTARTINGVPFDGTANITVPAAAGTLTGTTLSAGVTDSSLTSLGTLTDLTVINPIVGSINGSSGSTTGNAATATALQTARTINGVAFDGTADITVAAAAGTLTGTTLAPVVTDSSLTSVGTLSALTLSGAVTGATSYNGLVINANTGVVTSGTWNGTAIAVANGGTGSTNGSITGTSVLSFISNTTNSLTLDSGTTGDINIGTNSNAKTINLGTGVAVAENINIGGTGANVISIGNTQTAGSVNIGAAMTTGAISIGGTGLQTGTLTFGGGTGTQIVNLGTGNTGIKTLHIGDGVAANVVTLGSTSGAATTTIQSGTGNTNFTVGPTSSSGKVQIGNSATTTPDLLVLDNGTADPTGTNGGIYYNTATNKFRCFQSGVWTNCINGDKFFLSKSTDQSVTNTTLTSDTALTFAVGAGETWVFNFFLFITNANSAQPDFKSAILGAAGWTCSVQMSGAEANGGPFPQATTTDCDNAPTAMVNGTIGADGGNGINVRVQGIITTTSAGSVTLQFAQNTSSASAITIKGGSSATAFKVGGADFAELYYSNESLAPGTVVSIDPSLADGVKKSDGIDDSDLLGIVSTNPGMVIADKNNSSNGVPVLIALSGRVPVKVNTENGAISPGDYLTSSSQPGVAMKSGGVGGVIGQAMSPYDGEGEGTVMAFVKNFDLRINAIPLLSVTPGINSDGSDNGLSTLLSTVLSENAHDPIAIIEGKIASGAQFLTDVISARITAIRGYFEEVFAKKVHTEQLCVKKSDGSEVCATGDQLDSLLRSSNVAAPAPAPAPAPLPIPEDTSTSSDSESSTTPDPSPAPEIILSPDAEPSGDNIAPEPEVPSTAELSPSPETASLPDAAPAPSEPQ